MASVSIHFAGLSLLLLLVQGHGAKVNATQVNVSQVPRTSPTSSDDESSVPTRVAVAGTSLGGRVVQQRDPVIFPTEAARIGEGASSSSSGILALPMMALLVSGVAVALLYTRRGHELASSFGIVAPQGEWTKMPLKDIESGGFPLFAMGLPLVNQAVGALGGWIPNMRQGENGTEMKRPLNGDGPAAGYAYSDAGSDCDLPEAELKVNLADIINDAESSPCHYEAEVPRQCDLMDFDPSEKTTLTQTKLPKEEDVWGFPPMQKMSLDDMGLFDSSAAKLNKDHDDFFDDDDDF